MLSHIFSVSVVLAQPGPLQNFPAQCCQGWVLIWGSTGEGSTSKPTWSLAASRSLQAIWDITHGSLHLCSHQERDSLSKAGITFLCSISTYVLSHVSCHFHHIPWVRSNCGSQPHSRGESHKGTCTRGQDHGPDSRGYLLQPVNKIVDCDKHIRRK